MPAIRCVSPVALLSLVLSPLAVAQAASFEVAQHGHAVGTASYSIDRSAEGFASTSITRIKMQGLDYALSKTEQLTVARQLSDVQLSATVNGSAVLLVAKPEAAQLLLNFSASGRKTSTRLAAHPNAVLLPDFDAGALQTLLAVAAAQNNRGLWAVLPKQAGSVEPVTLATYADMNGTLDGKTIAVHHLVATIAGAKTELFTGPEDQLLQAELPQNGFAMVRKGFVLQPPARAPAAPSASAQAAPAK